MESAMPIKRSAYKELRKSKTRYVKNVSTRSELKSLIKGFEKMLAAKKSQEAKDSLVTIISKMDRAVSKGILKSNTASRKISRLMKRASTLSKA